MVEHKALCKFGWSMKKIREIIYKDDYTLSKIYYEEGRQKLEKDLCPDLLNVHISETK